MDSTEDSKHSGVDSFPIVGVGASAGGLTPTRELLSELGEAPGLAVVVIHHLDPSHESNLVSVLAHSTGLPVAAAVDQVRVEPNRVYVLPPGAALSISHGVLQLSPRLHDAGLHLPINHFFEALAEDCEGRAVGVVLSGSGYDGAAGVKAIKSEGGITLAQDGSAQFASMPESAIATGCVDFIQSSSGIARQLRRLAAHAPVLQVRATTTTDDREYAQVLALMRRSSGVDFAGYKQSTLKRRLARRLVFHDVPDLAAYLELLKSDAAEVERLCEDVLIHVTSFFR
ncbi:MAG: chemotaxis protein CheB, partial [Myxococcales bacterium]